MGHSFGKLARVLAKICQGDKSGRWCFKKGNKIMESSSRVNLGEQNVSEAAGAVRGKLEATIEKAKATCQQLQDKTAAAAKAADQTVRDHPYSAMGIAFGVGLLVGALAMRSRRD
jgi:ElaB/YqjD/DUF883 family membrane-anchored ribosome-binding protein